MKSAPQRPEAGKAWAGWTPASASFNAREQIGLATLALKRVRRNTFAHVRRSRLLSWRYRAPTAEDLLLVPSDLRVPDPSFAEELAAGFFGLAGAVVTIGDRSPFDARPPSELWAQELQGFGWLRNLDAAGSADARDAARSLVATWIARRHRHADQAWEPAVVGRRVISWLTHADLLLNGAARKPYAAIMRSLAEQIAFLAASWRNAPEGYPRLVALAALVQAHLCLAGNDRQLARAQALLAADLERQIAADGGHGSRNPSTLVEALFDLLPLRRCFAARGKQVPQALVEAIGRMTQMLRHLRLGDGTLARFNGTTCGERDALATALAYDDPQRSRPVVARGGYVRLQKGPSVVVVDAGPAPPLELAGAACAGCLSFELSAGAQPVLVNRGTPGPAEIQRLALARATASHNTLCLGELSSSKLVRNVRIERQIGTPPIRHPDEVTCEVREVDGGIEVAASHDGYVERFGLVHKRTLAMNHAGTEIRGLDELVAAKGVVRFAWDVPYAIHFHLHPDAEALIESSPDILEILLPESGEHWRLRAEGAVPSIEDSVYFADATGSRRTQQIVLRGACCGTMQVAWTLTRIHAGQPIDPRQRGRVSTPLTDRLAETSAAFDAKMR